MMVKHKLQLVLLLYALNKKRREKFQGLNDGPPDQNSPNAITISFSIITIWLVWFCSLGFVFLVFFFGGGSCFVVPCLRKALNKYTCGFLRNNDM